MKKYLRKALEIMSGIEAKKFTDSEVQYLFWIFNCYMKISNVPGHVAEIGVAGGRNAVYFGLLFKLFGEGSTRQYIGFDTFNGYVDRDLFFQKNLSETAWKDHTLSSVIERCRNAGVDDYCEFIAGDALETVPNTLQNHKDRKSNV